VELDHLRLLLDELRVLDFVGVEVDLAHVVDDDGDLHAIGVI
jgi:hypothetical protein